MAQKLIYYDGLKHADLNSDDPSVWTFLSNAPRTQTDEYYSRVAAAFRAFNLKANTVGNMPFCLYKLAAKKQRPPAPPKFPLKAETDDEAPEGVEETAEAEEYDNSATWENKVGFLPNPSELFRIDTLSYMMTNTIYNMRTSDALGYRQRGLYNAIPTAFAPYTNALTGQLMYIERRVGTSIERYQPEDKRLFRAWRLDHTTEVLPSEHTEARAIMSAAGVIYHADFWVQNFYRRGGIKPTLIAMKGMIDQATKEEKERGWDAFLRGIGRFTNRVARIFNAESMEIQPFGSGVDDMKDNRIYEQALANIAMGTGMPLSLLMANSANYATAKEEKATWYENDIIPLCNWIAYEYNRQIFNPLGLRLEFHPETLDPQQEDETERATAMLQYMSVIEKCPTYDVFIGMAATMGLELSDELVKALETYYADKEKRQEEMQAQMGQAGYVVGADGKPVPAQLQDKEKEEDGKEGKKPPFSKWVPSLDQVRELQRWQELAFRKLKRGDPLTFEWRNDTLPADAHAAITARLALAADEEAVKAAFEVDTVATEPAPADDIKALVDSINKMADGLFTKPVQAEEQPIVIINNGQKQPRPSLVASFAKSAFARGEEHVSTNQ